MSSHNNWKRINIAFKLKSPLHIGYLPFKGSVIAPTRYYVPGRNFWGAVTERVTKYLCDEPSAKDYREIGKKIMDGFRFSYFYLYDGSKAYLPCYTEKGLQYDGLDKYEFERRFIGSRISTAIDNNTLTAKDESLHEIEFINNKFKDEQGNIRDTKIIGCIWVKENTKISNDGKELVVKDEKITINGCNIFKELILGGESKYGFGHVLLDPTVKAKFPIENEIAEEEIKITIEKDKPLIVSLKYDKDLRFKGDIELLGGRGYFDPNKLKNDDIDNSDNQKNSKSSSKAPPLPGKIISTFEHYFAPGTLLFEKVTGTINWNGILVKADS